MQKAQRYVKTCISIDFLRQTVIKDFVNTLGKSMFFKVVAAVNVHGNKHDINIFLIFI